MGLLRHAAKDVSLLPLEEDSGESPGQKTNNLERSGPIDKKINKEFAKISKEFI